MKAGAADFEELAVKLNTIFNEKVFVFKSYAGPATLKSGELAEQTKSGETFTLPAVATANQTIGVFVGEAATTAKVTTSGGAFIFGDFIKKEATITLAALQKVWLQSNGTGWIIIAGEPKREQTYSARKIFTKAETEAGVEPSATREADVVLTIKAGESTEVTISVGAVIIATFTPPPANMGVPLSIKVPAGVKWKVGAAKLIGEQLEASTRLL